MNPPPRGKGAESFPIWVARPVLPLDQPTSYTHLVRQYVNETESNTQLAYVMSTLSDVDQNRLEEIKMFVYEPWHESKISTYIEQTSKVTETSKHQDRKFTRNDLVIYTDGSMVESKVGAAVVCRNNNQYE